MGSKDGSGHSHKHEHKARHKDGTLLALGNHFAHVEVVLNAAEGKVSVYFTDAENEHPVRLQQPTVDLTITKIEGQAAKVVLTLKAVEDVKTGEKSGDSSQFEAQTDELKGKKEFNGVLGAVTIKGKKIDSTPFNWPKGNEDGHGDGDGDHDHRPGDNKR